MRRSNGIIALIYNFLGIFITYIISIIMVKMFSLDDYGYYNIFLTYVVLISTIVQFGIPQLLIKEISIDKSNINSIFNKGIKFILYLWFISIIIILMFKNIFYDKLTVSNQSEFIILGLLIIFILIETIRGMVRSIYIAFNDFTYNSFFEFVLAKVVLIISLVIAFMLKLSINYALVFYMIFNILIISYLYTNINKRHKINISLKYIFKSERLHNEQIVYSFYMMAHLLTNTMMFAIDKLMVNKFLTLDDVGIYSFLFSLSQMIGVFSTCLANVFTPQFVNCIAEKDYKKLAKVYKDTESLLNFLTLPILTTCIVFCSEIVGVFGEEFLRGNKVFLFLIFAQFFNGFFGFNGTIINMSKYYKMQLYIKSVFIIFIGLFDIYFIINFGLNGVAYASAIGFMLYNLTKTVIVYIYDKILPFSKTTTKQICIFIVVTLFIKIWMTKCEILNPIYKIIYLGIITIIQYPLYILAFEKSTIKYFIDDIIDKIRLKRHESKIINIIINEE